MTDHANAADGRAPTIIASEADFERVRQQLAEHGWYAELFERMRSRVTELIERAPEIPTRKGLAFYDSCPHDHAWLVFDPYAPHRHVCSKCGRDAQGDTFDGAWVRQFHDWLGKRLVEAGIVYRIDGDMNAARAVHLAAMHYVRRYRDYPLTGNLLGPTRLFQSTFLEAFWLVDLVAAYDLVRPSGLFADDERAAFTAMLHESAELVRSFDEGISNRQAFNNAGMGAVALLTGDEALVEHVLEGPHGFAFHMRRSVTQDGIWYEGETYHFATLHHLLNLAEMARTRGIDLYDGGSGHGSLRPLFDGPLEVMLPDRTFPSRKDSWFGRGIAYHREIYELGFARYGDERYGALLADAYARGGDRGDLSWRAFLHLEPRLPDAGRAVAVPRPTASRPLPGTGMAVLRGEEGRAYASLEYGAYGGGHGHPDRLHLSLHADGVHWSIDPGTGFYHLPELAWYRSTLAHTAVTLDAASQNPTEGRLQAFGVAGEVRVAQAVVEGAYPGAVLRRTLALVDGLLLDVVDVEADGARDVDWAMHLRAEPTGTLSPTEPREPLAPRGGHPFLRDVREVVGAGRDLVVDAHEGDGRLRVLQRAPDLTVVATAPGIPLSEDRPFHTVITRRRGARVRIPTAWTWGAAAEGASAAWGDAAAPAVTVGGRVHRLVVGDDPGLAVLVDGEGGLERVAWFGRAGVAVDGLELACDRPLAAAALWWRDGVLLADLPEAFGRVRLVGAAVPTLERVEGLPGGASWRRDDAGVLLTEAPGVRVWALAEAGVAAAGDTAAADAAVQVAAGLEQELELVVVRYGDASAGHASAGGRPGGEDAALEVVPPPGWGASEPEPVRAGPPGATHRVRLTVPNVLGRAALGIRVGEHSQELEVLALPSVSHAWRVASHDGRAELVLVLSERAGRAGRVVGEIEAPWLVRAPALFAEEVAAHGEALVRVPLPPAPVAPTAASTAGGGVPGGVVHEDGGGADAGYGEFPVQALVRRGGFEERARVSLQLAWCLPHVAAGAAEVDTRRGELGLLRLDRPEQAYWSEFPWRGPDDASAAARLSWDDEALHLECAVVDDLHVSDANPEDDFENDSVQLYLDFRPPGRRDAAFAPGVAAFVLAPDARREAVVVQAIAGSRELSNRGLAAPWFSADGVTAVAEPRPSGYRLRARFPYASLGVAPLAGGDVFRADLSLSDNDGGSHRRTQLVWTGARGTRRCYLRWAYLDPTHYGSVIVAAAPDGEPAAREPVARHRAARDPAER